MNEAIRRLMDEPPTPEQTERYTRLLVLWRQAHDDEDNPAAPAS